MSQERQPMMSQITPENGHSATQQGGRGRNQLISPPPRNVMLGAVDSCLNEDSFLCNIKVTPSSVWLQTHIRKRASCVAEEPVILDHVSNVAQEQHKHPSSV